MCWIPSLEAVPLPLQPKARRNGRQKTKGSKHERVLLQPYVMNETLPERALLTPPGDAAEAVDIHLPPAV